MHVESKHLLILRGNFNTKLIQKNFFFCKIHTYKKIYNWLRLSFSSLAPLSSGCPLVSCTAMAISIILLDISEDTLFYNSVLFVFNRLSVPIKSRSALLRRYKFLSIFYMYFNLKFRTI